MGAGPGRLREGGILRYALVCGGPSGAIPVGLLVVLVSTALLRNPEDAAGQGGVHFVLSYSVLFMF